MKRIDNLLKYLDIAKQNFLCFCGIVKYPVVKNALALYGVTFVNYLLPLITVPYLARILGPAQWGMVVLAQAFGIWLSLIIEYGFSFSATRSVAQNRDNEAEIASIVSGILGAKTLLLIIAFITAAAIIWIIPIFRLNAVLFWLSFLNCIALGFAPFWYFQGMEFLAKPSLLNISIRAIGLIPVFILVKKPEDAWVVIALQAITGILATTILLGWMYRKTFFLWPKFIWVKKALHSGWHLFVFSAAGSVYSTANILILSLFVSPAQVGYYGGADRIHKAFTSVFGPIGQAFYPHITRTLLEKKEKGLRDAKRALYIMTALGIFMGLTVALAASYWVKIFLGIKYSASIPVLLILSLQLPLTGISRVLGVQWMLPLNMDRSFTCIVVFAGLINVVLALILIPYGGIGGMAWAFVLTELLITISMCYLVKDTGIIPFLKDR